ncbi:hypothetical protein [Litoreibacter ascidiaceicola]|uniref:hypothetical protein n=1 Tax=Litoreibacter ascidiaceicola TaxID=1486859 RepID=UPI001587757B|nr:hypothetical protein [Litoreibacter ascidiaceicola]
MSDPIWSRLYGPYGIDDVAGILGKLEWGWDKAIAKDLYWEKLHHQDDIYPVTFAALPWLWKISDAKSGADLDSLLFFSHVLYCATTSGGTGCDGQGPRGKYRGLPLNCNEHALGWLPKEKHLRPEDTVVLARLEDWFTANLNGISEICLDAITEDSDYSAAALTTGFSSLHGSENAVTLVTLWADEHDFDFIREVVSLSATDISLLRSLSTKLTTKNRKLANFIREYISLGQSDPN